MDESSMRNFLKACAHEGEIERTLFWFEELQEANQLKVFDWKMVILALRVQHRQRSCRSLQRQALNHFQMMLDQGYDPNRDFLIEMARMVGWRRTEYWTGMFGYDLGEITEKIEETKRQRQERRFKLADAEKALLQELVASGDRERSMADARMEA